MGPKAPMLRTKPQGHWPFGSREEDFWRVFTIYGHGGHLGHVTQTLRTNFCSPIPLRLHMKFGFDWLSRFGQEVVWKVWTNGWTTDHGYTISSPMSLKAQVRWAKNQCVTDGPENSIFIIDCIIVWTSLHNAVILTPMCLTCSLNQSSRWELLSTAL